MAEVNLSVDVLNDLFRRIDALSEASQEALELGKDHILDEVQRRAKEDPRWVGLADYIDAWDEHDRFWIGVRNDQFVSEAFAAEYGTEDFPPSPILRSTSDIVRTARQRSTKLMRSKLPVSYQK